MEWRLGPVSVCLGINSSDLWQLMALCRNECFLRSVDVHLNGICPFSLFLSWRASGNVLLGSHLLSVYHFGSLPVSLPDFPAWNKSDVLIWRNQCFPQDHNKWLKEYHAQRPWHSIWAEVSLRQRRKHDKLITSPKVRLERNFAKYSNCHNLQIWRGGWVGLSLAYKSLD